MLVKTKWPISDFSLVLENDDHRNSHLEELELFFRNFRLNVAAQIEKRLIYEKGTVIVYFQRLDKKAHIILLYLLIYLLV